jgi:serine/threonine protein kinase
VPLHGNRGLRIEHSDVQARLKLKCTHPGASTEDDCRGILLEKCHTDLSRYVQKLGQRRVFDEEKQRWCVTEYLHFDPEIKRALVKEVLSAYKECHDPPNSIGHRDVKPQNILVNHVNCELTVKLCDFATSARFKYKDTSETRVITEDEGFIWASPEMLNKKLVNAKISHDLWGIGW